MFDIVRRRKYVERRVLIDSARILDSPFDDSLICLSGAELELLRNVCLYLRRQDTFVASYFAQHYLTPDSTDWDALQAVVAGLEEKLMGCAELEALITAIAASTAAINTTVPRSGVYAYGTAVATGPEPKPVSGMDAPADKLTTVTYAVAYNTTHATTTIRFELWDLTSWRYIKIFSDVPVNTPVCLDTAFSMKAGYKLRAMFIGQENGDNLHHWATGYITTVPT